MERRHDRTRFSWLNIAFNIASRVSRTRTPNSSRGQIIRIIASGQIIHFDVGRPRTRTASKEAKTSYLDVRRIATADCFFYFKADKSRNKNE